MVEVLSKRYKIKQVAQFPLYVNYLFDRMKLHYLSDKVEEGRII